MENQSIARGIWRFFRPILIIDPIILIIDPIILIIDPIILIIDPIILVGVGASFWVVGEFTWPAYSGRLFWAGIGTMLIGGLTVMASLGSYSTLGASNILTASGDAPIATERIREHIQMNEGRYSFIFRMFLAGGICCGIAALVEVLSG